MFLKIKYYLYIILVTTFIFSCARKGSPNGGPKDLKPPILTKAVPDTFKTNVDTDIKKITLNFDEYVVLKDFNQNFLVSPPIEPSPNVMPQGSPSKEITINFNAPLEPETTYSFNFGQSIQDNNENNKLPYFSYVISTGDHIDSLELGGKINFPRLNKVPDNIISALYKVDSSYTDSLIYKTKPFYVAKVDSALTFKLKNLKPGSYKLVAFNDSIPNLRYDPKSEYFAFYPGTVSPIDTHKDYNLTLYKARLKYRFVNAEQVDQGKLAFYFEGNPEKVEVHPLSHTFATEKIIHKPYSDTLLYYFNPTATGDTLTEKRPRLKFTVTHKNVTDTIPTIVYDKQKTTALNVFARGKNYVPGKNYQIETNYPIDTIDKNYIRVSQDTVDLDFEVKRLQYNRFALDFPLNFDTSYKVEMFPNAIIDVMQRTNDSLQLNFNVKEERNYGNLVLNLANKPNEFYWLKLYDSTKKEIESIYSNQDRYEFKSLTPGSYTFKLLVDENNNHRYDTGDFLNGLQAEKIYVYPGTVEVKAFWDIEETWVIEPNASIPEGNDTAAPAEGEIEDRSNPNLPDEVIIEKPEIP